MTKRFAATAAHPAGIPPEDDRLLLMAEVSEITRLTIDTLRYLRGAGEGPPAFRLGKRVVYPQSGLHRWIREHVENEAARCGGDSA